MSQQQTPPPNNLPPHLTISGSSFDDWIDKYELMRLFNLSKRTVEDYIDKGIFHYTTLNKRKLFYKPHVLRDLESRYR